MKMHADENDVLPQMPLMSLFDTKYAFEISIS